MPFKARSEVFFKGTFVIPNDNVMNLEGLTPKQQKFIVDLSKRIQTLESKLVVLQAKMVRIDPTLTATLAKSFKHLNLN
jgi:hypothetical protein